MKDVSVSTRRQFLAIAIPAATIATVMHCPAQSPQIADDDQARIKHLRGLVDDDKRSSGTWDTEWTVQTHPWGRKFLLAMWSAIEACDESRGKAPQCNCSACIDMNAFGLVLRMFASSVESEYVPVNSEKDFPEWMSARHNVL